MSQHYPIHHLNIFYPLLHQPLFPHATLTLTSHHPSLTWSFWRHFINPTLVFFRPVSFLNSVSTQVTVPVSLVVMVVYVLSINDFVFCALTQHFTRYHQWCCLVTIVQYFQYGFMGLLLICDLTRKKVQSFAIGNDFHGQFLQSPGDIYIIGIWWTGQWPLFNHTTTQPHTSPQHTFNNNNGIFFNLEEFYNNICGGYYWDSIGFKSTLQHHKSLQLGDTKQLPTSK